MIAIEGQACSGTVALRALGCVARPDGLSSCWEVRSACGCTLGQGWRDDRSLCSSRRPLCLLGGWKPVEGPAGAVSLCFAGCLRFCGEICRC